jgi:hypothetical protein
MADGVHVVGPVVSAPQPATGGPGPAGAYLPPTDPVLLAAGDTTRDPRAWALVPSTGASEALRAEPGPRAAPTLDPVTTTNMTAAVPSVRRPVADLLADLPFCVPDDAVARVVAAASATAALAFLLPWTNAPLVGRGGYTAGWGLASSSYLIPWLLVVVLLLVSLLPDRTPPSIRAGAVPLAVGGLLLGLVWPHVLGPAGSHVGSLLTAAAAAALIAAGLVALQPARRGGSAPPV